MSFAGKIYGATKSLSRMFTWIGVASLVVMILTVVMMVIFRYVLSMGLQSARELVGIGFMISIFAGIGYCWFEKGHVRILLFVNMFSHRWQNYLERVAAAAGLFLYALLTYKAFFFLLYTIRVHKGFEESEWPYYPFFIYLFLGSLFFTFQLFVSAVVPQKSIDEVESQRQDNVSLQNS